VRVPKEAGCGKAKITLSFPGWPSKSVTPATFEGEVKEAPADE